MPSLARDEFVQLVAKEAGGDATLAVPVAVSLLSDQLTPVLAYRRLVAADEREAPSFLLESVEGGERQGLYDGVVVFDHVEKVVFLVQLAFIASGEDAGLAWDRAVARLHARLEQVERHSKPLASGLIGRETRGAANQSNLTREQHAAMVA